MLCVIRASAVKRVLFFKKGIMIPEERKVFQDVVDILVTRQNIPVELWGEMVHYQGKAVFNTEGYNILYCLAKLTETLKEELL